MEWVLDSNRKPCWFNEKILLSYKRSSKFKTICHKIPKKEKMLWLSVFWFVRFVLYVWVRVLIRFSWFEPRGLVRRSIKPSVFFKTTDNNKPAHMVIFALKFWIIIFKKDFYWIFWSSSIQQPSRFEQGTAIFFLQYLSN